MNDDDIWDLARKPVTEFVESIKEMDSNIDKLVKFYLKHTRDQARSGDNRIIEFVDRTTKQLDKTEATSHDKEEEEEVEGTQTTLSPLALAKLELAIVFAINACYWMYLVTHGEDPSKKEIAKDLERVRLFMNRAKEVEEQTMPEKYSSSSKRPKIDKEASKRLCVNNMSLKSEWV